MTSAHGMHHHHEPTPTDWNESHEDHRHDRHADGGAHAGHDKHAGHSVEMFRRKFWGTFAALDPGIE